MVVLFHLNAASHVAAITQNAWVAVDFFFVLSGFVLMSGFGGRVSTAAALRRYGARRLARLYPLHLVALLVLFALIGLEAWRTGEPLFAKAHGLGALLQCLTLVQGFTTQALSWNFPSWSISIELWGSLGLGLALYSARRSAWIVVGLAAAVLAGLVIVFGEPEGPATTAIGALLKAAHYLSAFALGVVLFRLFQWLAHRRGRPPSWLEWPALTLILAVFAFPAILPFPAAILGFGAVILVFAFESGPVSAALRRPGFQALGRWSYSIYLIHPLWTIALFNATLAMGRRLGRPAISGARLNLGGPFAMDLLALICLALVIATAAATYRLVERPGTKLADAGAGDYALDKRNR